MTEAHPNVRLTFEGRQIGLSIAFQLPVVARDFLLAIGNGKRHDVPTDERACRRHAVRCGCHCLHSSDGCWLCMHSYAYQVPAKGMRCPGQGSSVEGARGWECGN